MHCPCERSDGSQRGRKKEREREGEREKEREFLRGGIGYQKYSLRGGKRVGHH